MDRMVAVHLNTCCRYMIYTTLELLLRNGVRHHSHRNTDKYRNSTLQDISVSQLHSALCCPKTQKWAMDHERPEEGNPIYFSTLRCFLVRPLNTQQMIFRSLDFLVSNGWTQISGNELTEDIIVEEVT